MKIRAIVVGLFVFSMTAFLGHGSDEAAGWLILGLVFGGLSALVVNDPGLAG